MSHRSHRSRSSTLDDLATISTAFKGLPDVSPVSKAFSVLEWLRKARTKDLDATNGETNRILQNIFAGKTRFLEVLRWSEMEHQRGYEFCKNMVKICDILGSDNIDIEGLQALLDQTRLHARETQFYSTNIVQEFNKARHGLLEIGKQVPLAVDNLVQKQRDTADKKRTAEKRVIPLKLGKAVATSATAVVGVIAGVGSIAFPPALLVLPVVLPIMVLLGDYLEVKNNKRIKECKIEERKIREAITQLEAASGSLSLMNDYLDQLSSFWIEIELILKGINDRLGDFRFRSPSSHIQLQMIKSSSNEAKGKYKDYYIELNKLRLQFPDSPVSEDSLSIASKRIGSTSSSRTDGQNKISQDLTRRNATEILSTSSFSSSKSTLTDRSGSHASSSQTQPSEPHRSRHRTKK
ncbi:hypothetical protein BT96DRAFT_697089 [Gymnopus androsaceus JB14]|uniref:Uncharacterized protein n=1 Tax=Gymnopus androsaceus JB14 TaxID=1447944 RepID=A0A6A4ICL2_9AGAR|nr:hypothetical protein BT96DRAFT_697089 [Gymnopus androsaceus JB14]